MGTSFTEIKKRMEKDVDEVGKIAQNVRAKLEAIDKTVLTLFCETKQPVIMLVLLFSDSSLSLVQNLDNQKKLGCERGTGVDRSRTNMTKYVTSAKQIRCLDYFTSTFLLQNRILAICWS